MATGFHVLPLFFHLDENYLRTAFKTLNYNFFTPEAITLVQNSPDWLVVAFAGLFCAAWFCFLIGYASQFSCILMTATCSYFYALNAFYIGTLSWDILPGDLVFDVFDAVPWRLLFRGLFASWRHLGLPPPAAVFYPAAFAIAGRIYVLLYGLV